MPQHRQTCVFVARASDAIDENDRSWIEVLPTAEKVRNGPMYFTVTPEDLAAAAEYISENAEQIMVDRDHEGTREDGSTRAAGWFTGETMLVAAGDETPRGETQDRTSLWAEIEWTPTGLADVRGKEFKFVSAEWYFQKKDKKTGLMTGFKKFIAATLTNRPFFPELAPVIASVVWATKDGLQALRDKVYAALNPGAMDNARYWVIDVAAGGDRALVQEYGDPAKAWVIPFSTDAEGDIQLAAQTEWVEAEQEWVTAAKAADQSNRGRKPFTPKEQDMDLKVIAKSLGLAEDASEEDVNKALAAQAAQAAEAEDLKKKLAEKEADPADESELAKAQARIAKLEAETREKDVDSLLSDAVREQKILPVQKDALRATATKSDDGFESVKALLDATPAKSIAAIGSSEGGSGEENGEPSAKAVAKARDEFSSKEADPDDESLNLHAKAMAHLAEQGKNDPTADEYIAACEAVAV